MNPVFQRFERIVRTAQTVGARSEKTGGTVHPFDERNIHPDIASVSLRLFDDGHYSQATFEALKLIEGKVKLISGLEDTGFSLMMSAFSESAPKIQLTDLLTMSDKDEQKGYRHMFAGIMAAIRNPRGHETRTDPIDVSLDHLSLASVLLRTIDNRKTK